MRYFRRICRVDKLEYEEQQSPTAQDPTLQDSIAPDPIAPDQDPIPQGTHRIEFFGAAQDDADKPAPDGTHRIEFFGAVQADDLGAITQGTHRIEFFGASQDAIAHHYDVGNDFYAMWLDPTMTYSCALWDDAADLHAAQLAKIDYHIAQARAHGADRVLDIGCGWGPTLHRLVSVGGVRNAVGLTLSKEQAAYVRGRNWPGVDVRIENWAEHRPQEPYDAIVSMGAFEHFARLEQSHEEKVRGYRTFFRRCHEWLKPGGYLSLQTISYENSRSADFSEFFAKEIFPESDLPRLADIAIATETLFEVSRLRNDRADYVRTVNEWRKRLRPVRAEAEARFGSDLVARYHKFLQLLAVGCHTGTMGLLRLTLRRIDQPRDRNR